MTGADTAISKPASLFKDFLVLHCLRFGKFALREGYTVLKLTAQNGATCEAFQTRQYAKLDVTVPLGATSS